MPRSDCSAASRAMARSRSSLRGESSRTTQRSVTTSWNAATPTSVPCWMTGSSSSPLSSACTTVSRCGGSPVAAAPLLDDALVPVEPADRLGAVAGEQHEPIAVARRRTARTWCSIAAAGGTGRRPSRRARRRSDGASCGRARGGARPTRRRRGGRRRRGRPPLSAAMTSSARPSMIPLARSASARRDVRGQRAAQVDQHAATRLASTSG